MAKSKSIIAKLLILSIRLYQLTISPMLSPRCRFHPSCSAYSLESVKRYGFFIGGFLTVKRLLKCHPWHRGGFDPVPDLDSKG